MYNNLQLYQENDFLILTLVRVYGRTQVIEKETPIRMYDCG